MERVCFGFWSPGLRLAGAISAPPQIVSRGDAFGLGQVFQSGHENLAGSISSSGYLFTRSFYAARPAVEPSDGGRCS